MLDVYADVAENVMAMPVIKGVKTQVGEIRRGPAAATAIEAMMQNGLALQAGTSHDLGQNFGKAFDVQVSEQGRAARLCVADQLGREHAADRRADHEPLRRQGTGAASEAGAEESCAGADLSQGRRTRQRAGSGASKIAKDIGAKVDDREGQTPGAKFYHWERRGVPVVLELGPRDLASGNIVLKRRDTGTKEIDPQAEIAAKVPQCWSKCRRRLFAAAKKRLKDNTVLANSIDEVEEILQPGDGREGRRQVRDGAHEGRSPLRRPREGIQGDDSLHSSGRRVRRTREVHCYRRSRSTGAW